VEEVAIENCAVNATAWSLARTSPMVPTPIALGLTLCEKVIVEEATRNITLVNCFSRLRAAAFPFQPVPFSVCAARFGNHSRGGLTPCKTLNMPRHQMEGWGASTA
jgi:hypothetical protein